MRTLRASLFWRSFLLQAGFGDERRQGLGFAWAIDPALRRAYASDAAGLAAARARHLSSFNAQPYAAALPLGAAAALELRAGAGETALSARAAALKSALGAALSGAADAFFWGSLRPLAGACAVMAAFAAARLGSSSPFAWGAAAGLAVFNVPALWTRWRGLSLGLGEGEAAAVAVSRLPVQDWILIARRAAAVAVVAAVFAAAAFPGEVAPLGLAACAFAAGAGLTGPCGGRARLIAAAGIMGAVASAAGWGWAP